MFSILIGKVLIQKKVLELWLTLFCKFLKFRLELLSKVYFNPFMLSLSTISFIAVVKLQGVGFGIIIGDER